MSPKTHLPAPLVRGSLITLRRKCGGPNCRCATGKPHETPALSYSLKSSTKMLTLRAQDVREVRAALRRYQKSIRALEQQALAGIITLKKKIGLEKLAARKTRH